MHCVYIVYCVYLVCDVCGVCVQWLQRSPGSRRLLATATALYKLRKLVYVAEAVHTLRGIGPVSRIITIILIK